MNEPRHRRRSIGWTRIEDGPGAEWADVVLGVDRLAASGVAVTSAPVPYRLDYRLRTGRAFVTRRLQVRVSADGWWRTLDLGRSAGGAWTADARSGGDAPADLAAPGASGAVLGELETALDCDLGLCPLTNTMPMLRHGLLAAGRAVDFVMAFVSVPDLSVRPSAQRYTPLGGDGPWIVRYESGDFRADLTFDADGLVIDYPGLGRRLGTGEVASTTRGLVD